MNSPQTEVTKVAIGTRRSWIVAVTSFLFAFLQSVCTAVMALSGLRLLIGLTSLAAASVLPGFLFRIHADLIRIPMLIIAVLGAVINLYVLWRVHSLRSRPASQWRVQPISAKQKRSELFQWIISFLTLGLAITESLFHHYLHGSF